MAEQLVPWAAAWGTALVAAVTRTGGEIRYRAEQAYGPERKRQHLHIRNHDIRRLSFKRVVGSPVAVVAHVHPRRFRG